MGFFFSFLSWWQQLPKQLRAIQDFTEHQQQTICPMPAWEWLWTCRICYITEIPWSGRTYSATNMMASTIKTNMMMILSKKSGCCIHTKGVTGLTCPLLSSIPAVKLKHRWGSQPAGTHGSQAAQTAIQRKPGKRRLTIHLDKGKMMMGG